MKRLDKTIILDFLFDRKFIRDGSFTWRTINDLVKSKRVTGRLTHNRSTLTNHVKRLHRLRLIDVHKVQMPRGFAEYRIKPALSSLYDVELFSIACDNLGPELLADWIIFELSGIGFPIEPSQSKTLASILEIMREDGCRTLIRLREMGMKLQRPPDIRPPLPFFSQLPPKWQLIIALGYLQEFIDVGRLGSLELSAANVAAGIKANLDLRKLEQMRLALLSILQHSEPKLFGPTVSGMFKLTVERIAEILSSFEIAAE